jgi:uncharacterized membrane protein YdbT with pleckstrin-like domain
MISEDFELEHGELTRLSVRKHWLVFTVELLPFVFFALIPFIIQGGAAILASANPAFTPYVDSLSLTNSWVRFTFGMWWLLMWTGAFNTFTRYYLDVWIITTQRIIDVHQFGFFRRQVTSFLLSRVQDVTTDVEGLLPTLFHYGSLRVETAGDASENFSMDGISHPEELRNLILREVESLRESEGHTQE